MTDYQKRMDRVREIVNMTQSQGWKYILEDLQIFVDERNKEIISRMESGTPENVNRAVFRGGEIKGISNLLASILAMQIEYEDFIQNKE